MRLLELRRRAPTMTFAQAFFGWTIIYLLVLVSLVVVYRVRRRGRANVPSSGPVVYVANHQSQYDPPIIGLVVGDRPFSALARSGLFECAPFGWLIRLLGAISLRQGKGDASALRAAIEVVRRGGAVLIFPEGGRTHDGVMAEFKHGLLSILKRTPATVVPLAVEGAFDVWPRGRRYPRLVGRLAGMAGSPIPAEDLLAMEPAAAMERLRREIETMRLDLRRELRAATDGCFPAPGLADRPYWETAGATARGDSARQQGGDAILGRGV